MKSAKEMLEELEKYLTKERTLEVLGEIQKILQPVVNYNPVVKAESDWEDTYERTVLKGYNVQVEHLDSYVYEMPKE